MHMITAIIQYDISVISYSYFFQYYTPDYNLPISTLKGGPGRDKILYLSPSTGFASPVKNM